MKQALLIVDLQNDFLPGGALAVPKGNEIIPVLNAIADKFEIVLASLDWHPKDHVSFASTFGKNPGDIYQDQILWPTHCVQNTFGSDFPSSFEKKKIQKIFHKGSQKEVDSYSVFLDQNRNPATNLDTYLKGKGIEELFIAGLATDYCVLETVLDALKLGYRAWVIQDGCKAVNIHPEDGEKALEKMKQKGALFTQSSELLLPSSLVR